MVIVRNIRRIKCGLLLAVLSLGLTSCGPEKSSLDLDREKRDQALQQKNAENDRLVGTWVGTLTIKNQYTAKVRLLIWKKEVPTPSSGGAEPIIQSVLTGYFTGEMPKEFGTSEGENAPFEFIFTEIVFDGRQKIVLKGSVDTTKSEALINASLVGPDSIAGLYLPPRPIHLPNGETALFADFAVTRQN